MRYLLAITILACVLGSSACKGPKYVGPAPTKSNRTAVQTAGAQTNGIPEKPVARPANVLTGRIVGVRQPLRFVIVDFAGGRMPQLDQRLHVYRLDQKVAEVKISGPYLGTTVAADVTAGEAMMGDLVRDK